MAAAMCRLQSPPGHCTHPCHPSLIVCPRSIRGNGEVLRRDEFEQRKAAAEAARLARLSKQPKRLASQGRDLTGCPLLQVSGR